jgi:retron-type reverse transcriptase
MTLADSSAAGGGGWLAAMKRHGNLFEQIVSWPNLLQAAHLAARGKRFRENVARFNFDYERELLRLQRELQDRTYQPGPYHTFYINEPKRHMISAAPFCDRVVHYALCNVIEPIFESRFIFDSYACRKGKGTHRALDRFQSFCRRYADVLQCDIQKFFPSMDPHSDQVMAHAR